MDAEANCFASHLLLPRPQLHLLARELPDHSLLREMSIAFGVTPAAVREALRDRLQPDPEDRELLLSRYDMQPLRQRIDAYRARAPRTYR